MAVADIASGYGRGERDLLLNTYPGTDDGERVDTVDEKANEENSPGSSFYGSPSLSIFISVTGKEKALLSASFLHQPLEISEGPPFRSLKGSAKKFSSWLQHYLFSHPSLTFCKI